MYRRNTMTQFKLHNLTCPNCALKIEEAIKQLEGVSSAEINLYTSTLKVVSSIDNESLKEMITRIVESIEEGVEVTYANQDLKEKDAFNNYELIIAGVLFVLGIANVFNTSELFFFSSWLIAGYRVVKQAFKSIVNGNVFNEFFLMALATITALIIGERMEASAVMLFYQLGEFLQHKATINAKKELTQYIDSNVKPVTLTSGHTVDPRLVETNQLLQIHPGEAIQLDGVIVEGQSFLDTKLLTGESVLRKCSVGDEVKASMINTEGLLTMKVTKPYNESTLYKIIELLSEAPNYKSKAETFMRKFARIYTPIVVFLAVFIAFGMPLIDTDTGFQAWVYRACVFLVASCPCALLISVPMAYIIGLGSASKNNILVKSSQYFEDALKIKSIVLDKTGTITQGNFVVSDYSNPQALYYAALLEQYSKHPIAKAILDKNTMELSDVVTRFTDRPGQGISGKINGQVLWVGNDKLMEVENIEYEPRTEIGTHIYVAKDKEFIGSILIQDELKEDTKEAIEYLKQEYKVSILSGDRQPLLDEYSELLEVDAIGDLYPQDKLIAFEAVESPKAYVGDGINDALTLQQADLGFSMGHLGSQLAIEASDVVLGQDKMSQLVYFFDLSKNIRKIITQNIILAIGFKLIVLILGFLGIVPMTMAVIADVGVTMACVLNSFRIKGENKNVIKK